jgi:AcrR family transcriptional regulator
VIAIFSSDACGHDDNTKWAKSVGNGPDSRREAIVRAALPLVIEHGNAVTTRQIARAAGIGEGTVFRVFAGKEELLDACVMEALSPAHALDELALVSMDQPLVARLTEAARPPGPAGSLPVREALAELFEPERESLRLPPEQAALIFLGLLFVGTGRPPAGGESADPSTHLGVRDLVDVFLHGVLSQPAEN